MKKRLIRSQYNLNSNNTRRMLSKSRCKGWRIVKLQITKPAIQQWNRRTRTSRSVDRLKLAATIGPSGLQSYCSPKVTPL